jgi:hypothetical protein
MTVDDVKKAIEKIRAFVEDEEEGYAHDAEDGLRAAVLEAIASGAPDPAALAAAALKSDAIEYDRFPG